MHFDVKTYCELITNLWVWLELAVQGSITMTSDQPPVFRLHWVLSRNLRILDNYDRAGDAIVV